MADVANVTVLVEGALVELGKELVVEEQSPASSHCVIVVAGLEAANVRSALGCYLTASLAGVIQADARVDSALIGSSIDERDELIAAVQGLIGETNDIDQTFRDTRRNAWIGEGIGHALLMLRARHETALLAGGVAALKGPHPSPYRAGLDLVALYRDGQDLAFVVGEGKTTEGRGSDELTNATGLFASIDRGERELEIRLEVAALKPALPTELAERVGPAIWRERRCYLPLIVFGTPFNATGQRQALADLLPDTARKRVIVCRLEDFYGFFDSVADSMRAAVYAFWA